MNKYNFQRQFSLSRKDFLGKLDFLNWYRYFAIIKALTTMKPKTILEIGPGGGTIKNIFEKYVEKYQTMDVNQNLQPDYLSDIRDYNGNLKNSFDCVIAADVLEHIAFDDFEKSLKNIFNYLEKDGHALITIPHRASYFLLMTPTYRPKVIRIPTGFCSPGAFYRRFIKRKIWIDPDHEWEIGDGEHSIKDIEKIMKDVGFRIEKREKLLYVDFWVLKK